MTQQTIMPPTRIVVALVAALSMAFAAGCADTGPAQAPNNDFELRAMIASDREAIHAMDERMGRIENQLQELTHGGAQAAGGDTGGAPAPAAPPAGSIRPDAAPVANAPASTMNLPIGAPPASASAAGAPPSDAGGPPGPAVAPGGNVPPDAAAGAAASPENPAPGTDTGTTTIASAPGPAPGAAPPSDEESADTTGNASPPSDEGAPEGSTPGPAAETDNPEASPVAGTTPPEGAPNGEASAPGGGEAAAPGGGEVSAPGGEEIASVPPPSTPPENAPAAAAAPRWPADLARELQSPSNAKGGAGKLYVSGLDAMKNRDYSTAVQRFETIQKKYPHSDLTEPAAYFSANALNEMGKYDQAILQYNDLVMRYPKGKYASESLLREAQAFVQINDKIDARLTLQKLSSEHPGTPQAATANAMMKSLDSN